MLKFIKNLFLAAWIKINGRDLIDLILSLALILLVSFLYRRWEALLLLTNPDVLFWLLIIYTFFLFIIVFRIFLILKKFVFLKRPEKAIEAKKSFINKPEEFEKIRDVKLRPKLKKREENN